ncbi:MAG: PilZ domain-containing protein [Methylobacter sp.]|nr:PilZ domain-containing protein [Methylobacter sp.]MDP2098450.1 PilZ domain-containing protein [Methylobacter sp.]MDP2427157.1 PilZ domain-containing protein [Methylobacter sp.]MDP3056665.1 PilZ domain-containing protein [Methylobacter sp.]MDP3364238.1 PilZ domain-containing protein [Methylobacter sp.]
MAKSEERRGFFRIDDEINLFYKKVDEATVTEPHRISGNMLNNCSLSTAMGLASQESTVLLRRIEKDLPDVADYLKLMDSKFELLAQAIMMQSFEVKESETRNVNISATGIAFDCEDELKEDDYLEVKLLLASSLAVVVTYGRVVFCKKSTSNDRQHPYFVGVDFINMSEEDRELLIKYVVKKQLQQIRDKK